MLHLKHKNLGVGKDSMNFVSMIYQITQKFPDAEMYGITRQLRRAAISIPSNISEGASRNSTTERKRFYRIARSSLVEIDTQLEISVCLRYLNSDFVDQITEVMNKIFAKLTKLIQNTK